MLVVDGIELILLDEAQEMGKFQGDRSIRLKEGREPSREIVDVRNMGVDVVADEEVGPRALRRATHRETMAEELAQDRGTQARAEGRRTPAGRGPRAPPRPRPSLPSARSRDGGPPP